MPKTCPYCEKPVTDADQGIPDPKNPEIILHRECHLATAFIKGSVALAQKLVEDAIRKKGAPGELYYGGLFDGYKGSAQLVKEIEQRMPPRT